LRPRTTVAHNIRSEFRTPERQTSRRRGGKLAPSMAMPETTVHEHARMEFAKNDVRATWKRSDMKPVPKPTAVKESSHDEFRLRIPSADSRHHACAGDAIYDIRQRNFSCTVVTKNEESALAHQ
jgi:hypothetical protein